MNMTESSCYGLIYHHTQTSSLTLALNCQDADLEECHWTGYSYGELYNLSYRDVEMIK